MHFVRTACGLSQAEQVAETGCYIASMSLNTPSGFIRFASTISWRRFFLVSLLAFCAAGLMAGIVSSANLGRLSEIIMATFAMSWFVVLIIRVVLRGNPEYQPAEGPTEDTGDDVPAPEGTWSRASWFLARMSWARFFGVSLLFLVVMGLISAKLERRSRSLVEPAGPVEIQIMGDKGGPLDGKVAKVIRVGPHSVVTESRKPPKPPKPHKAPATSTATPGKDTEDKGVEISAVVGPDGKQTKRISIGPKGLTVEELDDDGNVAKTVRFSGVKVDVQSMDPKPAAPDAPSAPAAPAAPAAEVAANSADAPPLPQDDEDGELVDLDEPKAKIYVIDASNSTEAVSRQIERAIKKARSSIESQLRTELEYEFAEENVINWDEIVTLIAFILVITLTMLKLMAGSQYRARVAAYRATQRAEGEALKRQLSDAQLKAMQAQVEPHFLFNTMASVDYLIDVDPKRASKMQKTLISYLRAALPQMREASTTLAREIKLVSDYLEILKVRMDERLSFTVDVPEALHSADIPPMMLQSLVENAIKHGLEPKPEGGEVCIRAERIADEGGDRLRVTVADTGVGLATVGVPSTRGTGLGLSNIRDRLALYYGDKGKLVLEPNQPSGTLVTIEIPFEVKK
jgi:signal transduction histidine kinase